MSPNGQPVMASPAIVTTWFPLAEQHTFERHSHPEHQLVWASAGVVAVTIDDLHWVLPRTRALWVPAGRPHPPPPPAPSPPRGGPPHHPRVGPFPARRRLRTGPRVPGPLAHADGRGRVAAARRAARPPRR